MNSLSYNGRLITDVDTPQTLGMTAGHIVDAQSAETAQDGALDVEGGSSS